MGFWDTLFSKKTWEDLPGQVGRGFGRITDPRMRYDARRFQEAWQQPQTYGTPGMPGEHYAQRLRTRMLGFGASPAEMRQQQALVQAQTAGAQTAAAQRGRMGAAGAMQAGLGTQQRAGAQAMGAGMQERIGEQARAQQDYLQYLQAATQEQIAQDKLDAMYSQMNLDTLLAEQEARRKARGGIFGAVGNLLGSIFS